MSDTMLPDDQTEIMEELQPRTVPQPPVSPTPNAAPVYHPPLNRGMMPQPQPAIQAEGEEAAPREDQPAVQFAVGKINDYLQWLLMVLETILGLRFLLKMLGADPSGVFANFIFSFTDVLLVPFRGIAPNPTVHANQAFEFSTLFAAIIYFLIFYALRRLLRISSE